MNLDKNFLTEKIQKIAKEQLQSEIRSLRFIGGGSFGKVFKGERYDGTPVIFKAYFVSGMEEKEAEQLKLLSENNVNVEYMYAFVTMSKQNAYAVIRVEDNDSAVKLLTENNIPLVTEADIAKL